MRNRGDVKRQIHVIDNRQKRKKTGIRKAALLLLTGACLIGAFSLPLPGNCVYAVNSVSGNNAEASKSKKEYYQNQLFNYMGNLYIANDVQKETRDKIEKLYASANSYIANTTMTESELSSYVSLIESQMSAIIGAQVSDKPATTQEFIAVADNYSTQKGTHGQEVQIALPIMNLGTEDITNVVVTPVTSNLVKEWPFEIGKTSYTQTIDSLPGNPDKTAALQNRRELYYTFKVRDDVLTGYYKLQFELTYTRKGVVEKATLPIYAEMEGAPGSGKIDDTADEKDKTSTPRIIVTGFETEPKDVYAGETFMLNIHVKNTSSKTAVSNVEFDLAAAVEGKDENAVYAAFLPTSGSNTVYIDTMPMGGTADLNIEMTAKADLSQKPYALDINMKYEDDEYNPYESKASVSIPVKQESKFETSSPEIMPAEIMVGEETNVMFSVYNTGKTTLYNVKVRFEGDSVEGGDTFVGKIDSGATGNVDTMLTGIAPTMDDSSVKVFVSYEDVTGKVTEEEQTINIMVTEAYEEPAYDPMMDETEEPKSPVGLYVVLGVLAVVIIIIVSIVIFRKRKKKIREAKELEKDLENLDDLNAERAKSEESEVEENKSGEEKSEEKIEEKGKKKKSKEKKQE